jgi:hypothetical protein
LNEPLYEAGHLKETLLEGIQLVVETTTAPLFVGHPNLPVT